MCVEAALLAGHWFKIWSMNSLCAAVNTFTDAFSHTPPKAAIAG